MASYNPYNGPQGSNEAQSHSQNQQADDNVSQYLKINKTYLIISFYSFQQVCDRALFIRRIFQLLHHIKTINSPSLTHLLLLHSIKTIETHMSKIIGTREGNLGYVIPIKSVNLKLNTILYRLSSSQLIPLLGQLLNLTLDQLMRSSTILTRFMKNRRYQ